MSVVKCKNCGKEISKKASICPHCGVKTHPIRDIVKIVIIVLVVLISLVLIGFILSGGLTKIINEMSITHKYKKYLGSYELVGSIENYNSKYNGIIYASSGQEYGIDGTYNINEVYTTIELKTQQRPNYPYVEKLDNTDFIPNPTQDYIILNITTASIYRDEVKTHACFKLDKEYLTQVDCVESETGNRDYIENLGLKYKKVK